MYLPATAFMAPYLPSELWHQILTHLHQETIWRNVRRTNRQLKGVAEQHSRSTILPTLELQLTFGLPCYDGRNPLRGRAIFEFASAADDGLGSMSLCRLRDVEPEHQFEQFVYRWERMAERDGGYLPGSLEWRVRFSLPAGVKDSTGWMDKGWVKGLQSCDLIWDTVKLKDAMAITADGDADGGGEGGKGTGAAVNFDWMATMTAYHGGLT